MGAMPGRKERRAEVPRVQRHLWPRGGRGAGARSVRVQGVRDEQVGLQAGLQDGKATPGNWGGRNRLITPRINLRCRKKHQAGPGCEAKTRRPSCRDGPAHAQSGPPGPPRARGLGMDPGEGGPNAPRIPPALTQPAHLHPSAAPGLRAGHARRPCRLRPCRIRRRRRRRRPGPVSSAAPPGPPAAGQSRPCRPGPARSLPAPPPPKPPPEPGPSPHRPGWKGKMGGGKGRRPPPHSHPLRLPRPGARSCGAPWDMESNRLRERQGGSASRTTFPKRQRACSPPGDCGFCSSNRASSGGASGG